LIKQDEDVSDVPVLLPY